MNNKVRQLTEGAMMCAILGVLLFINRQFGNAFEALFVIVLPIPIILYTVKYGLQSAMVVYFASIGISLITGQITTIFYVSFSLLIGLVYGSGIRNDNNTIKLMFKTIFFTMILEFIVGYLLANLFGFSISEQMDLIYLLIENMLMVDALNAKLLAYILFISSIVVLAVMEALLIHMLSLILLKRLNIHYQKPVSIFNIKITKYQSIGLLLLIFSGIFIITSPTSDTIIFITLMIVLWAIIILGTFGYVAILWVGHVYLNKNISFFILLFCIFALPIGITILVLMGFIYNVIDFKTWILEAKNGKK